MIFEKHANLKYKYGNRHFWCRGYYVDTVGKNAKKIQEYIQNQLKNDLDVTYKLKMNGGDIKAVQGDSGYAQVNMVTDVYSHILDDDRRKNAELFEEAFYEKKNLDPQMHVQQENNNATVADEVDPELLAKVLANPEMRALLNSLAKTMK